MVLDVDCLSVGVSWKNFTKEEILEIAEVCSCFDEVCLIKSVTEFHLLSCQCIGGPALSRICKLFAKTYWAHAGGVPDLW